MRAHREARGMASNAVGATLVLALVGCMDGSRSVGSGADPGPDKDVTPTAGKVVVLLVSSETEQEATRLSEATSTAHSVTASSLRTQRARKHASEVGYDPRAAAGLASLQASSLALDDRDLEMLGRNGFVVSARRKFPTMLYGYAALYVEDLPLYVSADSLLDSVYRSYDAMLRDVEETSLIPSLKQLLDGMRAELAALGSNDVSEKDMDFYLAVARQLLDGQPVTPVAGADRKAIEQFANQIATAEGHAKRTLFGVERDIDFSQFKPRGHYEKSQALAAYFRAMMWLGRIDLRLIETQSNGDRVFHRRQFEAALLLGRLLQSSQLDAWRRIDASLTAFVGTSDYMRVPEIEALLSDLGATSSSELAALDDQRIAQTIIDKGYGAQRIASQLIVNETSDGHTLALDRSFALFGQRYTVDSHVFSNVVFDRVPDRLMPDPLDVAYAALGNDAAVGLLGADLDGYAGALEATRVLVDAHEPSFWGENLYNTWLRALRALSPTAVDGAGLPTVTGTEAWDRRVLNSQLASWAQLRHNTILYAKQSYTSGLSCAYPDAYVEPYPEFFAALVAFADRGTELADTLAGGQDSPVTDQLRAYFENLRGAASVLRDMAQFQREGRPFTADHRMFINQAVHNAGALFVCAGPATFDGWYAKLDYEIMPDGRVLSELNPVISDVHTQPTDADGNDVGRVLHVATGLPRLMVVTTNGCEGPRAYAGLASSYYELITDHWQRLSDAEWSARVQQAPAPAEVEWTSSFVSGLGAP